MMKQSLFVAGLLLAFSSLAGAIAQGADTETEAKLPAPGAKVLNTESTDKEKSMLRRADFAEAMQQVAERQKVFSGAPEMFTLEGDLAQGGLAFGQTERGAKVILDGKDVMVDNDGRFLVGFGRDSALSALLVVEFPDGRVERRSFEIEDREFPTQRIDGLDQSKVSGFTEEQLAKIAVDSAKKKAARAETQELADWSLGFDWPVVGRISGVFGSQRILNGEPKRPHSGVDVAAPTGTPIYAPAPGVVRLAEEDMYFEGGLVLLDHGHWLESAFLHMSRVDVEPGQRVEKGDIIGAVGATGRVTGPHLHWSMKWAGELVDPQLIAGIMPKEAPTRTSGD
ncbi:M23 family metallopeptidase [Hyphococcus flavus]|uniref:M23 family metallopeptidase n=1 Tax=Hyphococcus flavus TaxID=1866326 RepID=A0AAF0CB85_9PROT|nr:M23 family metallopeptidase [Hyphococcus flavus]WDI30235.1 M23 family metallopeptidase [Hyphococcus flavus]